MRLARCSEICTFLQAFPSFPPSSSSSLSSSSSSSSLLSLLSSSSFSLSLSLSLSSSTNERTNGQGVSRSRMILSGATIIFTIAFKANSMKMGKYEPQVCFFIFGYFLPLALIICLYSIMIRRLLTQVIT